MAVVLELSRSSDTVLMPFETYGFERPFWQPFWGMLGEFNRDQINEYFDNDNSWPASVGQTEAALMESMIWVYTCELRCGRAHAPPLCTHREHMPTLCQRCAPPPDRCSIFDVPVPPCAAISAHGGVAVFMTILMVNLLIAQMGARYENMTNEGFETWLLQFVGLVKEYKDLRDPLPPPLNVVYVVLVDGLALLRFLVTVGRRSVQQGAVAFGFSTLVDEHSGFRMAMAGRTLRFTDSIACRLRDAYIQSFEHGESESLAAKVSALQGVNNRLVKQMDAMASQIERLSNQQR